MAQKFVMVTVSLIGLVLAMFIVFADSRDMVVDDIVTDTGVPAWEYAFLTYILFMTGGIIVEMATSGNKYGIGRAIFSGVSIVVSVLLLEQAVSATSGNISTSFTSMQTEFKSWNTYIAILLMVYLAHMLYNRE